MISVYAKALRHTYLQPDIHVHCSNTTPPSDTSENGLNVVYGGYYYLLLKLSDLMDTVRKRFLRSISFKLKNNIYIIRDFFCYANNLDTCPFCIFIIIRQWFWSRMGAPVSFPAAIHLCWSSSIRWCISSCTDIICNARWWIRETRPSPVCGGKST